MCYRSARTAPPLCSRCASRQSREIIAALCLAPSPSPRCHRHSCARLSFGIRPLFLAALLDALGACVQRPLALGLVGQFFPRLFLCSVRPLAIACPSASSSPRLHTSLLLLGEGLVVLVHLLLVLLGRLQRLDLAACENLSASSLRSQSSPSGAGERDLLGSGHPSLRRKLAEVVGNVCFGGPEVGERCRQETDGQGADDARQRRTATLCCITPPE